MANDIKIRLVSELHPQGFNNAVAGMKQVEAAYTASTGKILANAKGNVPKMVKAYKAILESGMNDAPKFAGQYFQNWANALIYNFSGGDAAKLKATLQKSIAEITNVGGEDNLAFINMTELNKNLAEVASMYDEASTGIESASRRKQAMYEKEVAVLRKLGLQQEEYNLTMKNAKEQMLALSPSMRNYESEMERLSAEYTKAKTNLEQLTAEQARASKGGLGQYVGTVVKGMLVHQAVAKAIQTVKQVIKEASQAAAEAEQRYNKLDTVFEGFTKTARDLTSTLASAIGVANSTAASALTTVGDLLQAQSMGVAQSLEVASDWVKRFQDIINFKDINESLDTFSSNIMAGFLGNTRNLRSIGVVIKDSAVKAELAARNMDKLTGSELELAKMNIRAEMTFKQLENAMGATEREWNTNLAVNRRLNEAWKEYRENLGESINSVLKPMKSAWTDILTEINKANKAQKQYNEGNKDINVYDIHGNEKDARTFASTIANLGASYETGMRYAGQTVGGYQMQSAEFVTQNILDQLNKQMIIFNASLEDVYKELGEKITPEMYAYLDALEDERKAEIQRIKDVERRTNILASASDSFDKFQETLLGITGVNFTASSFGGAFDRAVGSEDATNFILGKMASVSMQNIDSAIQSIAEADLSVWGDVIAGELEGLDIPKLFEKKMESVAQLFSAVWNESLKDGVIDDDEQKKLESIKTLYTELGKELDTYNAQLERQKNVTSALESLQSNREGYQKQFEQLNLSENEKALDDIRRDFEEMKDTLGLTGMELAKANAAYSREVYWLVKLQKAQAEIERKEKARTAILDAQNGVLDIQKQIDQLRMTDEQKALDDLRRSYLEQVKTLDLTAVEQAKLYLEYSNQAKALIRLQELTKQYNEQLEQEEKRKEKLVGYEEQGADYRTQLENIGLTDAQITRNALTLALSDASKKNDSELYDTILDTLQSFDELQTVLAEIDRQAYAEELVKQFDGMAYAMELATLGMDDNQKALYELDESYRKASNDAKLTADEIDDMTDRYKAQRQALVQLQNAQEFYTKLAERNALLSSYQTGGSNDYITQLANLGKSSAEIARAKMVSDRDAAGSKGDAELWLAIQGQIDAFDELQSKTKEVSASFTENITKGIFGKYAETGWAKGIGGSIANSTGGQIVQAGIEGGSVGGPWGAILGVLMAILSKTESFEEILSMVEPVIQMFDTLLKPLVPAIQAITDTLNTLVLAMIRPLLPIIKLVAEVIVLISTPIKMIHGLIDNIYIAVHNIVDKLTNWGRDQWGYNSIKDIANESVEQLKTIREVNFDIKKNTDKDDSALLEAYTKMRDNQMITASEYDALVAGLSGVKYDRVNTYNGTSWNNGSGGTTLVYTGDMKFTIEGTNLSADEIAEAVIRKQQQWATTGQYH